jgi:hypothetical protein
MHNLHGNIRAGITVAALLLAFPAFAQSASDSSASGTPGAGTTSGPGAQSTPDPGTGASGDANEEMRKGEARNEEYPTQSQDLDTGPAAPESSGSSGSSTHEKN